MTKINLGIEVLPFLLSAILLSLLQIIRATILIEILRVQALHSTILKSMFLTELSPVVQKMLQQPLAFAGGFASGILQLKLEEEPLSKWLEEQGISSTGSSKTASPNQNGKPQSIDID